MLVSDTDLKLLKNDYTFNPQNQNTYLQIKQ